MLLKLDFGSEVPIYMQIRNQIVLGIAQGQLRPGERLPTIRALAEECGINMMTANRAYQLLRQEGYLVTDRRSGTVVAPAREQAGPSPETVEDLRLRMGELRLAGLSAEEAVDLCRKLYEEGMQ